MTGKRFKVFLALADLNPVEMYRDQGIYGLKVDGKYSVKSTGPGRTCPLNESNNARSILVNIGRADVYHGGFPTWWRNETIRGAAIWDVSTVGADFNFIMDSSSSHDWKKQTLNSLSEIGITVLVANSNTCRLTSVDTWFNSKYSFAICSNCNHNTYDVRTVAGHEFGHWLVLEDYPMYDFWSDGQCLVRDWHGTDHTLCNDDVEGIIELYGED